jgi:hypothetical protein
MANAISEHTIKTPNPVHPMTERIHAEFSPSKLRALEISPLFEADPNRDTHPAADEGTMLHEAIETNKDAHLTEDQIALIRLCQKYVDALPGEIHKEIRLDIMENPVVFGFADAVLIRKDDATLVDFKFGNNKQEPTETNPAAQAYALGVFKRWPNVQSIQVLYMYPRLDVIDHCAFHRSDMPTFELRIETIIARAKAAIECTPNNETCIYCIHKPTCRFLHAWVLPIALRYSDRKRLELEAYDPQNVTDPSVMGKALDAARLVIDWADSVKRHALLLRQEKGLEIPGWELATRSARKTIPNAQLAYETATQFGLSHEQVLQAVDVNLKRLLEVAKEKAISGGKAKIAIALEDKLRDTGNLVQGEDIFYMKRSASK